MVLAPSSLLRDQPRRHRARGALGLRSRGRIGDDRFERLNRDGTTTMNAPALKPLDHIVRGLAGDIAEHDVADGRYRTPAR